MNPIFQIATSVLVILLTACASQVSSVKEDINVELDAKQGYLMLAVDTNYNLRDIRLYGKKNIVLTSEDLKAGSNYILASIPAGEYRVESIRIGSYIFKKFEKKLWSFEVKENVISYVGHLDMQTKSHFFSVSSKIQLLNKSSYALEYLEENFKNILASRKLQYWGPGKDAFFETVIDQTGVSK